MKRRTFLASLISAIAAPAMAKVTSPTPGSRIVDVFSGMGPVVKEPLHHTFDLNPFTNYSCHPLRKQMYANHLMQNMPLTSEDGMVISTGMTQKFQFKTYKKRTISFGNRRFPLNLYEAEK